MLSSNHYLVRRKIFALLGAEFEVYDENNNVVLYAKQKAFKWKEDLRLFTDSTRTEEVLSIKARRIMDFSAAYDVTDSKTGKRIGTLKRKGFKSIIKDEWIVMDEREKEVGIIAEDTIELALIRRFLVNLIPQNYDYVINGKKVADIKQQFNPFVFKMDVDILSEQADKRIVLAAAVLLGVIEGRQE